MENRVKKLTRSEAQEQAARLMACPMLAPQSPEGRREIVDSLLRHCVDQAHAERTMTRFLDTAADIRGALTAVLTQTAEETRKGPVLPDGCPECWTGVDPATGKDTWAPYPRMRTIRGCDYSQRCTCARGAWLAANDKARALRQPAREERTA